MYLCNSIIIVIVHNLQLRTYIHIRYELVDMNGTARENIRQLHSNAERNK